MNILIYIPGLTQEHGGIKQYSIGLLKLCANDITNNYFIYYNNNDPEVLSAIENNPSLKRIQDSDMIIKKENYIVRKAKGVKNRIIRKFGISNQKDKLPVIDILCIQYQIDIIHCPNQYLPPTKIAKLITTLHDVQEIHFPEYFSAEERANRSNAYLDFLRRADFVIVSYEHVKKDLIKYFNVPKEKISTLLLKMQSLWFERLSEKDIIDLSELGLPEIFLLYPANTWQHKNHLRLIEAVSIAKEKHHVKINLVCTGHKNEHFEKIEKLLVKLNLQDQVLFTGIVDETALYSLYKTCSAVIIPTAYEAGSFPLYESILMNVPVICSNVTSLPETIGSDEFVFDPFDIEDIAEKMIKIWNDENYKNDNLRQLMAQVKVISENNPLPVLQEIYASLYA